MAHRKACDVCYKRKIQCDSADPKTPCNWCAHQDLACTFNRVRGRRKKKDKESLSQRLQRLEETLAFTPSHGSQPASSAASVMSESSTPPSSTALSAGNQERAATSSPRSAPTPAPTFENSSRALQAASPISGDTTSVAFGQIYFGGCHLGKISHHNGLPMFSEEGKQWISSRTGETVSFNRFRPVATQHTWHFIPMNGVVPSSPEEFYGLPDRAIVEDALQVFLHAPCRLIFPIVDPVLFRKTIAEAYELTEEPLPLSRITAKCCVLAFVSVAFLFQASPESIPKVDNDECAVKAHRLLADVMEDNSVVGLQAMFMLNLYQVSTGRLQAAAMLHAVACRSVFMLGGHAYRSIKPYSADISHQERESRQLRLMFWLCYVFDKDISLRMNQPPLMSEDYCDLTLPEGHVDSYMFLSQPDAEISTHLDVDDNAAPLFPVELRLSQFQAKTARLLYSALSVKKTEAQLFQDIRELDDELEDWRLGIAPEFRPSLSISESTAENMVLHGPRATRSMRCIVMHLEYHHLMTTIHRASGRCSVASSQDDVEPAVPYRGLRSSIALALEASRSTLILLRTTTRGLEAAAFWAMVFYPTTAVMALFLNVLQYPLAPQAKDDLKLLSTAAEIIRSMPVPRMTPRAVAYLDLVDDFVAELVRLGHRAIELEINKKKNKNKGIGVWAVDGVVN